MAVGPPFLLRGHISAHELCGTFGTHWPKDQPTDYGAHCRLFVSHPGIAQGGWWGWRLTCNLWTPRNLLRGLWTAKLLKKSKLALG